MTQFLDVRISPVGGGLATSVAVFQGTSLANYTGLRPDSLTSLIQGQTY
jgi:hypothetical protein